MYATLTTAGGLQGGGTRVLDRVFAAADGSPVTSFCLWADEQAARSAAQGQPVWTLTDRHRGRCANEAAGAVQVTWFHGPRSEAQAAADLRAGRERIWPAAADAEGLVDVFVLHGQARAMLVLTFVTAAEHLEGILRRILSTELLPGEDPALLGGPDRTKVHRVLGPLATAAGAR